MPQEITFDDLKSMAPAADPSAPKPAKSVGTEISFDDLNQQIVDNTPAKEPGFWAGVGTNIAGAYKTAALGMQLQAVESQPKEDELLKGYQKSLGEAQRNAAMETQMGKPGAATRQVAELQNLVGETRQKIAEKNSTPKVKAQVKELQDQVTAINEEMSGATPQDMGFWKTAAFNAATSGGVMLPSLVLAPVTGGATVPLAAIGLQTYASSYANYRTKNLDPEKAGQMAAIDGLTESMTELLPTSALLKKTGVFKKFLQEVVADVPGEVLANYIQNSTQAVAQLGPDATDEQIKETLKQQAIESTKQIASVGASTVMAGGAVAGTVAAGQRLVNGKPAAPAVEPTRGRPKPPPPGAPPSGEKVAGKPHFKSPAEAQAAAAKAKVAPEAVPAGSEALDMDELLNMQPPPKRAPGEVVDFQAAKDKKDAKDYAAAKGDTFDLKDALKPPVRLAERRQEIHEAWVQGDISSSEHERMLEMLDKETTSEPQEGAKVSKSPILDRLSKLPVTETPKTFTKKEMESSILNATDKQWQELTDKYSVQPHKADYQTLLSWAQQSNNPDTVYGMDYGRAPEYPKGGVTEENSKSHEKALREWAIRGEFAATYRQRKLTQERQTREGEERPSKGGTVTSAGDAFKGAVPFAKGFGAKIPVGTTVTATHGLKFQEPVKVKIVGHRKPILYKTADGGKRMFIPHLAEFPNGQTRSLAPDDVKEVHAPRPRPENQQQQRKERFNVQPTNEAQSAWGIFDRNGKLVENFTTEETARTLADYLNNPPNKVTATDKADVRRTRLNKDVDDLFRATKSTWASFTKAAKGIREKSKGVKTASAVVPAHKVLQHLLDSAKGPYKDVIAKLAQYLPADTTIHFQYVPDSNMGISNGGLYTPSSEEGGMPHVSYTAGGIYIPRDEKGGNSIYVRMNERIANGQDSHLVKTLLHEMWHAVTHDYIINNWDAPAVQKIRQLHTEAWNAMTELTKELRDEGMSQELIDETLGGIFEKVEDSSGEKGLRGKFGLYGLTNPSELIAEAMTNPVFMNALAKASPRAKGLWYKVKRIYNQIVGELAQAMGFNKFDAGLLHDIFNVTEEIAKEQKADLIDNARIEKETGQKPMQGQRAFMPAQTQSPYGREGQLKTKTGVTNAMKLLTNLADKIPGVNALRTKVDGYLTETKKLIAPETLGPKAVQSATILSKWIVGQMRRDASFENQSKVRREFWEKNAPNAREFIEAYERGWTPKDPKYKEIAEAYRQWSQDVYQGDIRQGIEYEALDNYLYHIYKDSDKLAEFMTRKFGSKWGNPKWMKERNFDIYEEAMKAGFKLKYTNPEDIMLARQHASDVAHMKIGALEEMKEAGLAWDKKPPHIETVAWRSPAGEWYYVHPEANAILHNAWNTVSLWSREGLVGDTYKGAMYLKNKIVPIKLGLSLFHFLHVLTINNATGMLRATKGLMLGNVSAAKWLKEMGKAATYMDLISAPRFGGRIRDIFRGQIPTDKILPHEALVIQYMIEGGMLPEQSHQYKSNARIAFKNALLRSKRQPWALGRAAYEMPFAAMDWMQHWMFEKWIPSIKTASYLKEVQTALESDPTLVHDQQRRQVVFHKLAKSVDNRHGEMVYKTMFWNKAIKDTAVVNLLSLGWQMGFLREYGGAVGDLADIATKQGDIPTKIKAGMLDRPLFVAFYTAQSLMYGGLLTWALTGEPPDEWLDYIYPRDGGKDKDGKPTRVNTMFYAREFASIAEHMEKEGVVGGLSHTVANKASGIFGLAAQAVTGVDDFGKEYRDPNGTASEKFLQTMDFVTSEMTPISLSGIKQGDKSAKNITMNVAGFSKAPGYATRGKAEGAIREVWTKYNAKMQTPYERAAYSKDMRDLRAAREAGDTQEFGKKFDQMTVDYKLSVADRKRIRKRLRKQITAEQSMFQSLTWQQQERLLDKMSPEDRTTYLPYSNKSHLRRRYNPERDDAE